MGAADVAAEYQAIKAEVAAKTSKAAAECSALEAQLQVNKAGGEGGEGGRQGKGVAVCCLLRASSGNERSLLPIQPFWPG